MFLKLQKHKKKLGAILSMETMIYIACVLIFTAMGVCSYTYLRQSSKIRTAQADLVEIAAAVSHYHYDMGVYPTDLKDLTTKASDGYHGPWLGRLKQTPWLGDYKIKIDGSGTSARRFVVYCLAKQGGGDGTPPAFSEVEGKSDTRLNQSVTNGTNPTVYVFEH